MLLDQALVQLLRLVVAEDAACSSCVSLLVAVEVLLTALDATQAPSLLLLLDALMLLLMVLLLLHRRGLLLVRSGSFPVL